jgi:FkbM family methyltransferase
MPEYRHEHVSYTRKEWCEVDYFVKVVQFLREKGIESFLDIGSNVGEVANILFEKIHSIQNFYLVEPQKDNFLFLKQNTQQIKNCSYYDVGIYYGKKESELFQDPSWKNVGAFTVEIIQQQFKSTGEKIVLKTLEELNLPIVDFVKIDVEGSEYNILENSSYLKNVKYVEIEFHDWSINNFDFIQKNIPSHKIAIYDQNMSSHLLLEKI